MISLRRLSAIALAAGLVGGAGCGSASPSAATIKFPKQAVAAGATSGDEGSAATASTGEVHYGDTVTIDRSEFERELKALNDNDQLQAASGGSGLSGAGKKTVDPRLAAGWLTFIIQDKLVSHEVERRRLQVTPVDTEEAKAQLAAQYGGDAAVAAFPKWFLERLIERNARALALRSALSGRRILRGQPPEVLRRAQSRLQPELRGAHPRSEQGRGRQRARPVCKGGEDFATVAKERVARQGQRRQGWRPRLQPQGRLRSRVRQAASELPVGELSDPVQTQYGFHILLVRERKAVAFESAREQIRALAQRRDPDRLPPVPPAGADLGPGHRRQAVRHVRAARPRPGPGRRPARARRSPGRSAPTATPTSVPLPGELPGTPGNPKQPAG